MQRNVDLLLVTVNDYETKSVIAAFEEETGAGATRLNIDDRLYLDLGDVNGTSVFLALSEMGSGGPGGAQQTVDKAIRALKPGAVIAVGLAFGVDEDKQSIGEILVSKQICLYDLQRRGEEIVVRGDRPHASTRLINYFASFAQTNWSGDRVSPGLLLTGEKLVDNFDYREQLRKLEVESIGGEMEAGGVYTACHEHKVDWIVIKAICDWGDGHKAENKDEHQAKAATNAVSFLVHCLKQCGLTGSSASFPQEETLAQSMDVARGESVQGTQVVDLAGVIEVLVNRFRFGWVQGTHQPSDTFAVFWPVTLRQPTPIHAVQAFAAAVLQRFGGQVFLCLDDLGNQQSTVETFCSSIRRWMERVEADFDAVDVSRFSDYMSDSLDAWPVMQAWLGKTDDRVKQILEISKILEANSDEATTDNALRNRKPRRILTPATVWSVLESVRSKIEQECSTITLGGVDEKPLWRTWRNNICSGERVGHLYNPKLGSNEPIHMAKTDLGWDSVDCVRDAFELSLREPNSLAQDALIPWTMRGCVELPAFIMSGFSETESPFIGSIDNAMTMRESWADAVSAWLF